jgi:hypothetical protein
MYFILEQVFLISVGIIVYLVVRTLPAVDGFDIQREKRADKQRSWAKKWQGWIDTLDQRFVHLLEKVLRRAKVWMLKLDNYVSGHITSMSHKTGSNGHEQKESIFGEPVSDEEESSTDEKMPSDEENNVPDEEL